MTRTANLALVAGLALGLQDVACTADPVRVLKRSVVGQPEPVRCLAFSPDGKILAVGTTVPAEIQTPDPGDQPLPEGVIELWDPVQGTRTASFRQSARTKSSDAHNEVGALAFSPDSKWIVGGDVQGYRLWEIGTGKASRQWISGMIEPLSPGWSPDGKSLALPTTTAPDAPPFEIAPTGVAIIDVASGKHRKFTAVELGYPRAARFSPDGRWLATAGHDATVRVFDAASGAAVLVDSAAGGLFTIGYAPDGRTLLAGPGMSGVMYVYEFVSDAGKTSVKRKGTTCPTWAELRSLEFCPDGRKALSNSSDGILLWDATTWKSFRVLRGAIGCLSPDGTRVAVVHDARPLEIEIWSLAEFEKILTARGR